MLPAAPLTQRPTTAAALLGILLSEITGAMRGPFCGSRVGKISMAYMYASTLGRVRTPPLSAPVRALGIAWAFRTGLNAVFVPHDNTWVLEHSELSAAQPPQRLILVEKFPDLRNHF